MLIGVNGHINGGGSANEPEKWGAGIRPVPVHAALRERAVNIFPSGFPRNDESFRSRSGDFCPRQV